jgi:hypothetical protein
MNRRELVQSLALAATGLAASGSVTPAAAAGSTAASTVGSTGAAPVGAGKAGQFATRTLGHISYSVADYGRSRDLYP